ncbi:MAG TPA: RagB/SusD family nutrient uptake outer membrane protein [Longimicrobiaceae bacterium]|nr:RagB/SusD family nutrient uptake outer membrane protein [Longimicrobiaceae bacterium]
MNHTKKTRNHGVKPMRMRVGLGLLAVAVATAGCNTGLDLTNPNAPTEQAVLTDVEGVIALSLGMQAQYSSAMDDYVRAPALVTDEWGTASKALAADQSLFAGEGIDPGYGVVSQPYYDTYRIARSADNLIAAVPALQLGKGLEVGITANAKLFKAMALGMAAQQYERLPIDAAVEGGTPVPRAEVFAEVIRLLESARADLGTVSDADLSTFRDRALVPNFDVRNTVNAMLARYYLFTEQYQQALEAAQRVDLTSVSLFTYPNPDINPIYNYGVVAGYVAPLRSWAEDAEPGDQRVPFWVQVVDESEAPKANPPTLELLPFEMYSERNDPFPVYVPGEMLLIEAEAQAQLGDLPAARALINQERALEGTDNTPGAELPPLSDAELATKEDILAQIAYERRYELYEQGLRWEDLRRLGQYVGKQPKVDFLPMPSSECQSNPNAGC